MGSALRHEARLLEAMVFAIETLRRLECRFAVARFGDKGAVLKRFDDPFNAGVGEQILSCMTYDEGSHPHRGLQGVCEALWPERKAAKPANTRRCVVMVTDGLSRDLVDETGARSFMQLRNDFGFWFGVVQIVGKSVTGHATFENALRIATSDMLAKVEDDTCDDVLQQLLRVINLMYVPARFACFRWAATCGSPGPGVRGTDPQVRGHSV